jgi:hypothetical protein
LKTRGDALLTADAILALLKKNSSAATAEKKQFWLLFAC